MAAIELDTEAADVHRESSSSDYLSDERSEVEGLGTRRPTMKYIEVLSKLEAMGVPEETLEGLSRNEAYDMLRTLRDGSEEVSKFSEQSTEDDVIKAEKLLDVAKLASNLHVSDPEGTLQDAQTAKERILLHMQGKMCNQRIPELLQTIRENGRQYKEACETLRKLAEEVNEFVKDTAMQYRALENYILREFPSYKKTMEDTIRVLSAGFCPLIVAGEVSSGKSSFLNILCEGDNFSLPCSEQETTSCVCEIKYGAEEKATVHRQESFIDSSHDEQFEVPLEDLNNYIVFEKVAKGDKLPYKKVEIFLPSQLLKCGIVLIDTPGVGSDRLSMTEFVENYLRDSAGLVYIIQDAINVHKLKRLFKLEASVTNAFNNYDLEDLSGTQYRRNLFILNKWDIIEEKEAMVHAVKKKLDNHWLTESNFSQLSEVLPLAATVDLQHLRAGYLSDRLRHVIEALKEVVPYNMKLSLQTRYKWLQHLILRVYYHSKRYLSHASALDKGTVSDTQKAAEEKLDKILKTGHKCFLQLLAFIDSIDLTETVEKLNDHLQKKSTRSAMSRWEEDECPGDSDMAMKEIEEQAKQKVEERIRKSIDNWENDNHVFSQCKVPVIQKVKEHLKELELDATSLSESLTSLQPVQVPVSPFSFRFILSKQGSAVGNRFTKLLVSRFQKYRKDYYLANKVQCMEEMTRETLDSLRDEDRLTAVVEEIVSFKEMHGSFVEQVNDLIGQFQEEIEDLKNSGTAKALRSKYEPLSKQCKEIRSRLLAWELRHIFDGNSLQSDEVDIPDEEPISSSSHAVILRGKRKRLGGETVLVKKYRGVAESDLTFINKEYRSLREMSCPDISKVYGMIAVDYCGSRRLCLVMEPGVSNLAKWLEIPDNVAAYNAEIIISHTLKFAYQIARAISVLHDHRVVNRNISSETIIVAEDDSESPGLRCKLYDIGVIQQTAMSLPLNEKLSRYSAPEVVTSTTFKPSMDIFSYGQVLSDLWYGTGETGHNGARKETKGEGGEFEVAPSSVGGLRIPSVRQQSEDVSSQQRTQPPLRYSELIVSCTDSQPKNRPIIEAVKKQLYTITSALEDGDSVDLRKR